MLVTSFLCLDLAAQETVYEPDVIARFHINNGKYLIDQEEFLEAHSEFDTALSMAQLPALKAESLALLAQLSATFLDDPNGALLRYEELVRNYQNSEFYRPALFQLGLLNFQQGRLEIARGWLQRFLKEFPGDSQAVTASFLLDQTVTYLQKRQLPPPPLPPKIGKVIRVALGRTSEARISSQPSFQAPSVKREYRGEVTFTAREGHLLAGTDDLGSKELELTTDRFFRYKGRRYRGTLILTADKDQVVVVNRLPVEVYLYSVVGSEMPSSWPAEALKAQAVAARTYAAYAIAHPIRGDFDLFDDVRSQAYKGMENESASTRKAVDATAGEVLQYDGRPILAYFTANNGGRSDDSKGAFNQDFPYLQVKDDPFSLLQPLGHWERQFSEEQIRNALFEFGFHFRHISGISIAERDKSGRAKQLDIAEGNRCTRIRCRNQFRIALNQYVKAHNMPENVPETLLEIHGGEDTYTLTGGGWGHGVGMSQDGARSRAEAGQDFRTILAAYYPLTEKTKVY
jgi:stage II sporulation protein D